MAAHVEGKGCSVLDMSGLAQKGGPVLSHVRLANDPGDLHSTRISTGAAGLVLGCDLAVTTSLEALTRMGEGRTRAAINSTGVPTAAFVANPDWQFPQASAINAVRAACSGMPVDFVDAGRIATALMGDAIAANMFMLGYAWQKGWVPLAETSLLKAIELNGVSIEFNQQAFGWGRAAAHDLAAVEKLATPAHPIILHRRLTVDQIIAQRIEFLTDYQDAAYAERYRAFVEQVRMAENALGIGSTRLTEAVARYYFKLMAGKDEYEVARLHSNGDFLARIADQFERRRWPAGEERIPFVGAARIPPAGEVPLPARHDVRYFCLHRRTQSRACVGVRIPAIDEFAAAADDGRQSADHDRDCVDSGGDPRLQPRAPAASGKRPKERGKTAGGTGSQPAVIQSFIWRNDTMRPTLPCLAWYIALSAFFSIRSSVSP
ncbi:MAG: pyruvate ferredoxin/flavodoxin oxidoreductase family protein [Burkholderiaceae bacterium]|nr:pyruvate ferredoxin/flavodoxin oxidoreductase family protein [Burkholderiaceae bacterium]